MSTPAGTGSADHHLGESLAALVDGELSHDSRDRVLAHLATCHDCKAEADAQRELKSVFAAAAPPAPSAGLLARLQSLPAAVDEPAEPPGPSDGIGPEGGAGLAAAPEPQALSGGRFGLSLLPGGRQRASLLAAPSLGPARGFRIHEPAVARLPRGHRFAFAAAGAVSLAAFAIGGAVSGAGPGPASAGSTATSTVAAGSSAPAGGARAMSGREEDRSRELESARATVARTAQHAVGFALVGGQMAPIGPGGQLLPLFGTEREPTPAGQATPSFAGVPGIPGAVSPR